MQTKLIEILSAAKSWLTAAEIADNGKWRSAANVGLALKQMTDVESRTSPTKKGGNGMPAKEYKLADKAFGDEVCAQQNSKSETQAPLMPNGKAQPTARKSRTVEMPTDKACCNAAKVVATTAGQEVAELLAQIKRLDEENTGLAVEADTLRTRIAELDDALGKARAQIAALNEQLMTGGEAAEAVGVEDVAKGYLVCAPKRKPTKFAKPESAVAKAKAAAKTTGRCEVFALVPVGIAVRKQINAIEFKRSAA